MKSVETILEWIGELAVQKIIPISSEPEASASPSALQQVAREDLKRAHVLELSRADMG